jgi:hypothetical protein
MNSERSTALSLFRGSVFFLAALTTVSFARPAYSQPASVSAGVGQFDILNKGEDAEGTWEIRLATRRFRLQPRWIPDFSPIAGLMATSRGTFYTYAGLRWDLPLAARWSLAPSFATGLYYRGTGAGKNLGGALEFRSGLELSHQVGERTRLGITLYHLSNAGIERKNPGSESLVFTVTQRIAR